MTQLTEDAVKSDESQIQVEVLDVGEIGIVLKTFYI